MFCGLRVVKKQRRERFRLGNFRLCGVFSGARLPVCSVCPFCCLVSLWVCVSVCVYVCVCIFSFAVLSRSDLRATTATATTASAGCRKIFLWSDTRWQITVLFAQYSEQTSRQARKHTVPFIATPQHCTATMKKIPFRFGRNKEKKQEQQAQAAAPKQSAPKPKPQQVSQCTRRRERDTHTKTERQIFCQQGMQTQKRVMAVGWFFSSRVTVTAVCTVGTNATKDICIVQPRDEHNGQ